MEDLSAPGPGIWKWQRGLRGSAQDLWEKKLLPGVFDQLNVSTRDDLVRSELAYHGAIDDLGRSAHLLALAIERELRDRVGRPLVGLLKDLGHPSRGRDSADSGGGGHDPVAWLHDYWTPTAAICQPPDPFESPYTSDGYRDEACQDALIADLKVDLETFDNHPNGGTALEALVMGAFYLLGRDLGYDFSGKERCDAEWDCAYGFAAAAARLMYNGVPEDASDVGTWQRGAERTMEKQAGMILAP